MNEDREREARSGAVRPRSTPARPVVTDPPSVPTRIVLRTPPTPRRGAVVPTMVPLARKRATGRGLRPGGAAATTEPMRDLVGAASSVPTPDAPASPPSPPRGPARSALVPPQQAPRSPAAAPPRPPHAPEDRDPTERMLPAPQAPEPAPEPAPGEPTERLVPATTVPERAPDAAPVEPTPSAAVVPAVAPTLAPAVTSTVAPVRSPAPVPVGRPARSVVVPASDRTEVEWAATSAVASGVGRRLERWRRRWTWGHTLRVLAAGMSAVVVLVCGLAWGATSWFETAVRQIAALDPTSAAIVDPAAQAGDQNFLVVGSDTRVGAAPTEDVGDPSDVPGARSDTVMIVHVPADRSRVTVVSFPRDLEIDRPSCERWDSVSGAYTPQTIPDTQRVKLNSAYQVGGPRCVTKVVQQLSGLAVNHFLGVDFSGFKDMVDAVDGVPICIEKPMKDTILGTVIPRAGTTVLTGDQALNFVRARHVIGDPTSDYGRIHRQQLFLSALLRQSLSAGTLLDLGKLQALVGAVCRSTYGENIEADQLLVVSDSRCPAWTPANVTFTTVPTTGVANSRGNEVLRAADDRALFDAIINDRPLPGQPGARPPPAPRRRRSRRSRSRCASWTPAATPATPPPRRLTGRRSRAARVATPPTTARPTTRPASAATAPRQGPSETSVAGALRGYGFTVSGGGTPGAGRLAHHDPLHPRPGGRGRDAAAGGPGRRPRAPAGRLGAAAPATGRRLRRTRAEPGRARRPPHRPRALVNAADSACG